MRAPLSSALIGITALAVIAPACGDDAKTPEYDIIIAPSEDDHATLQTAFIEAESGSVIGLMPGHYHFARELNLSNATNITLRGMGATREEVVLDFATQVEGDDGITVTAPGFTIENVWVKNSPGNGVVAHAEDSIFRNLKVSWDAGSVTTNGFYAVYPTDCKRTLIENVEVTGASDAGIYVGSCEYAIVRNNKVHGNVAGLEIENTVHADVYGNEVYDNSAGILALLLPNLKIKENAYVLFRDNIVRDNNRPNFAKAGTVVSSVPTGTGMLVLCGHDIEVRNNQVTGNKSGGVLIVSYRTLELLTSTTLNDDKMDPFVRRVYVHGNTFSDNGLDPQGGIKVLGQATLENVLWDGVLKEGETSAEICLGDTPPTFRNFKTSDAFADQSTDATPHKCTLPEMAKMESFE